GSPQNRWNPEGLMKNVHVTGTLNPLHERFLSQHLRSAIGEFAYKRLGLEDEGTRHPPDGKLHLRTGGEKPWRCGHDGVQPREEIAIDLLLLLARHQLPVHFDLAGLRNGNRFLGTPRTGKDFGD